MPRNTRRGRQGRVRLTPLERRTDETKNSDSCHLRGHFTPVPQYRLLTLRSRKRTQMQPPFHVAVQITNGQCRLHGDLRARRVGTGPTNHRVGWFTPGDAALGLE